MIQKDIPNKIYECENTEEVTFTFTANNTDSRIFWRYAGEEKLSPVIENTFTTKKLTERSDVLILFDFINETGTGGVYVCELSGSKGGDFTDNPKIRQAGDIPILRTYIFEIQDS